MHAVSPLAFDALLILDLTHYTAGPYCTKLLANYGARVTKIEPPEASGPCRRLGPFPDDVLHSEKSGLFLHLSTNKESLRLNLKARRGRQLFFELLAKADVGWKIFIRGCCRPWVWIIRACAAPIRASW
ncbi:Formyl-CoA:oxalate CoA-transferase [Candidatus Entotheonellaceae bacterium PAL068K]